MFRTECSVRNSMCGLQLLMTRGQACNYCFVCDCQNNWEPPNEDQSAQTKDQSPTDTTAAEKKELIEVSQQSHSKNESGGRTEVSVDGLLPPGGSNTTQPQDEAMNVESIPNRNSNDSPNLPKMAKVQMSV